VEDAQADPSEDINHFSTSIDPDSNCPIYWMFEVIHIKRKTQLDNELDASVMKSRLNKMTEFSIVNAGNLTWKDLSLV